MKKVTVIFLVIIIFFLLGIILSDVFFSGVNKIFKTDLETKKELQKKLTVCESELAACKSKLPEPEVTSKPIRTAKTLFPDEEHKIQKKIKNDALIKGYYYVAAVYKKYDDGTIKILILDPELIVDPPAPDIPTDSERSLIDVKIILKNKEVTLEWDPNHNKPHHVQRGNTIKWTCYERNGNSDTQMEIFSMAFVKFGSPLSDTE